MHFYRPITECLKKVMRYEQCVDRAFPNLSSPLLIRCFSSSPLMVTLLTSGSRPITDLSLPLILSTLRVSISILSHGIRVELLENQRACNNLLYYTYVSCNSCVACGGVLTDPSGTIESPGYPNVYPHGVNCLWEIRAEPGSQIRLSFNFFSVEETSTCRYDYVQIYNNVSDVSSTK